MSKYRIYILKDKSRICRRQINRERERKWACSVFLSNLSRSKSSLPNFSIIVLSHKLNDRSRTRQEREMCQTMKIEREREICVRGIRDLDCNSFSSQHTFLSVTPWYFFKSGKYIFKQSHIHFTFFPWTVRDIQSCFSFCTRRDMTTVSGM